MDSPEYHGTDVGALHLMLFKQETPKRLAGTQPQGPGPVYNKMRTLPLCRQSKLIVFALLLAWYANLASLATLRPDGLAVEK